MRISDWSSDVCSSDLQIREIDRSRVVVLRVERDLADVVTQRNGVADIARIGRLRGEEQRDVAHRKEGGQDIGDRLLLRLRIEEGGIAAEDQAVGWRNRRLELDTAVDDVAAVDGDDGLQRTIGRAHV